MSRYSPTSIPRPNFMTTLFLCKLFFRYYGNNKKLMYNFGNCMVMNGSITSVLFFFSDPFNLIIYFNLLLEEFSLLCFYYIFL